MPEALVRECREELGVVPTRFCFQTTLSDPNAPATDPATYHFYLVTEWRGEPALVGDEHTTLRWFPREEAPALPDLALAEYRPLLRSFADGDPDKSVPRPRK